MKKIHGRAYAKVNLALNIGKKRPDGYHEIDTIFQKITLFDEITLSPSDKIEIECNIPELNNTSNNAWKAAVILSKYAKVKEGVKIEIEKMIPLSSGLGGSSTDAASVLKMLNSYWNLGLKIADIMKIAEMTGADVPFFVANFSTARGKGKGEILRPLPSLDAYVIVVVPPVQLENKTKIMYSRFDSLNSNIPPADIPKIIGALSKNDLYEMAKYTVNMFEYVLPDHIRDIVMNVKSRLLDLGFEFALMSGAGPAVFALSHNFDLVKNSAPSLKKYGTVFIGRTLKEVSI